MSDFILKTGDKVLFQPNFGAATVVPPLDTTITGTGGASLFSTKVCVKGDEAQVILAPVSYTTPTHTTPGIGMIVIDQLNGDQVAKKTKSNHKSVLLVGSAFTAKLKVLLPAQQPPPAGSPTPDPLVEHQGGVGKFITTNAKFKGT